MKEAFGLLVLWWNKLLLSRTRICITDKMLMVCFSNQRPIIQSKCNMIRDKLATQISSQHTKLPPCRALVILFPESKWLRSYTASAEWSGPAWTGSNTVGRNQSLACLDPPSSPQSLRNCGARSDKPLICWLRECRRAMLRWWQHVY